MLIDTAPFFFYAYIMLRRFLPLNPTAALSRAGFTMIELLVVISVIGVLSVAVLSSINPIEQINKGRDTRTRNDAAQLINAVDRYFSIQEEYPWNTNNGEYIAPVAEYTDEFVFAEESIGVTGEINDWGWEQILADNAEVKSGFVNRLTGDENVDYVFYKAGTGNSTMYACFVPSSNAFQQEARVRCENYSSSSSTESSDSPINAINSVICGCADAGTGDCYICLP